MNSSAAASTPTYGATSVTNADGSMPALTTTVTAANCSTTANPSALITSHMNGTNTLFPVVRTAAIDTASRDAASAREAPAIRYNRPRYMNAAATIWPARTNGFDSVGTATTSSSAACAATTSHTPLLKTVRTAARRRRVPSGVVCTVR